MTTDEAKAAVMAAITTYGNATFACGEWGGEGDNAPETYQPLLLAAGEARSALSSAVDALVQQVRAQVLEEAAPKYNYAHDSSCDMGQAPAATAAIVPSPMKTITIEWPKRGHWK